MRPCRDLRQTGRPSPLVCFADGGDDILCWWMRRGRNNRPRVGLERTPMTIGTELSRRFASLRASAGTIVFGMEDGTVSIFGLVFGVAATTSSPKTVLIAGASGAVAAEIGRAS